MIILRHFMQLLHYGNHNHHPHGFVLLISVLLIGSIGLAIVVSILALGTSSSRASFTLQRSQYTKSFVNACAEEALEQIKESTSFTGSGSLSFDQGTCSYTVTSQGGQNRTITASSTVATTVRKAKVIINSITPTITVTSWQEVADF